ncbi:hypothetical protein K3495_g3984 [Podosphaera aphanis]|nr:hypothetical protein K3495_g3984 [Podosphaera aphanis]
MYTTSENGWTSKSIGLEWLKRVFLPDTATHATQFRMLLLDAHNSHVDVEFLWLCKRNRVEGLFLPPHSTHLLQLLDLSGFSAINSRFRNLIQDFSSLTDAAPVKKERFITFYHKARENGLTEKVIRAGWRAAGLVPYNPGLVLSSSQRMNRPRTPTQPKDSIYTSNTVYRTPQKPQDVYDTRQYLGKSGNPLKRARLHSKKRASVLER